MENMTDKYSIDQAKEWLAAMGEKGIYGGASARIRSTAIESLASVLGEDEPPDVASMLAEIDNITNRWATKNHANPETAQTYRTRAKTSLESFLQYQRDPQSFKPRKRSEGAGAPTRPEKRAAAKKRGVSAPPAAQEEGVRSCPVSTGELRYWLPVGGLTQKDVIRCACHLATLASDFDPVMLSGLFALARNERPEHKDASEAAQ